MTWRFQTGTIRSRLGSCGLNALALGALLACVPERPPGSAAPEVPVVPQGPEVPSAAPRRPGETLPPPASTTPDLPGAPKSEAPRDRDEPAPAPPGSVAPPPSAPAPQPKPAARATPDAEPPPGAKVRIARPQSGSPDCVEMTGSCTKGPNPICTSNAFVLECGKAGRPPESREWLRCVCP